MRKVIVCLIVLIAIVVALGGTSLLRLLTGVQVVVLEHTDYKPPVVKPADPLADDVFDPSTVPEFDPTRVDSRLAGEWSVNTSAAVTSLDLDMLLPDRDQELLKLHPSYQAALRSVPRYHTLLPSVNLIDGKAKQFDDRLYAALEEHWFQSQAGDFHGDLDFYQKLAAAVPPQSESAAYLAVGLELAGLSAPATNQVAKTKWKSRFDARELNSKPLGFYAWTPKLQQCYRTSRFFQMTSRLTDVAWMNDLVQALRDDSMLQNEYRQILARWARLSNLPNQLSVLDLVDNPTSAELDALRQSRGPQSNLVSLVPVGTNRESELIRKLFPEGFSASTDMMQELVAAIRRGDVSLIPTPQSGWYDYQVYALETLLDPKRGDESPWLLLSGKYKRRMLEAFQALMTKRKETHILRSEAPSAKTSAMPLKQFSPRLRLEPAPTYYLRMARSYDFLNRAVVELVGPEQLARLAGVRTGRGINQPLQEELRQMRSLFYGCAALSAEDLGMPLRWTDDELAHVDECKQVAETWLGGFADDPDLAEDTRVIVPVAEDESRGAMSTWATLGVRFARMKVSYHPDAPPRVKTADDSDWTPLESDQLAEGMYLIPVDEFLSIQLPHSRVLSRDEFRALCDRGNQREDVIKSLQALGSR